jgi:acyl dehydratase
MSDLLQVGQVECIRRTFSQSDFDRFAALSGDDNPIHVDPEFSARTKFGRTVAHGMFLYSTVCGLLGTRLPGPGAVQVEQELMFPTATPTGEEVEIRVEVTAVQQAESLADLTTVVIRPDGSAGLQGRTLVRLPNAAGLPGPASVAPTPAVPDSQSFKGMELGQSAGTVRTFTNTELDEYADLTGDTNPIITNEGYAQGQGLEGRLVPGGLLGGLFSYLLGTRLPGPGTNYLKQQLRFPNPAYTGQELTARVEIVRLRSKKQLVNLSTVCADPSGRIVCYGEALVLVSDV